MQINAAAGGGGELQQETQTAGGEGSELRR